MVQVAEKLAAICIAAKLEKRAENPTLPETRGQFEGLVGQERVLRQHADRLRELARSRAQEEDTSAGGYLNTLLERLAPVPHTFGEAAVRVPGMIAGGVVGHQAGKELFEPISPDDIHRALLPAERKGRLPFERNVHEVLKARGKRVNMEDLIRTLRKHTPEEVSSALRMKVIPFRTQTAHQLRKSLLDKLGPEGVSLLRRELRSVAKDTASKDLLATMTQGLRPHRLGGALVGAAAGGALTGIPFALRALYLKRTGGEAAARARAEMESTLQQAEQTAGKREELLKGLSA